MTMTVARKTVIGRMVAAVVICGAGAGCDAHRTASPTSGPAPGPTSSASSVAAVPPVAETADYSALLMTARDIGGDFNTPNPPTLNPSGSTGVAQLFANPDNSRRIVDTILIVADSAAAVPTVESTKAYYVGRVTGTWQPAAVGVAGTTISGTSPTNSQAITALLFAEGKAIVNLEFDSAASDPIDPAVAADIGRKQDAAVKGALPG